MGEVQSGRKDAAAIRTAIENATVAALIKEVEAEKHA